MKEATKNDLVMPCLLDRLLDDRPHLRTPEKKEIFTAKYLKTAILRDLTWLLNAKSKITTHEFSNFPEINSSVLNYGINDVAGLSYESTNISLLEESIKEAIINFEPRIAPESLSISVFKPTDSSMSHFEMEIRGIIKATPVPEELIVHSLIDVETGRFELWTM